MSSAALRSFSESLRPEWAWLQAPPDERPFGSESVMLVMAAGYFVSLIFFKLATPAGGTSLGGLVTAVSIINNALMCLYSMYSFIGISAMLLANWIDMDYNLWLPICDPERRFMRDMDFWMYHFYVSKFWEWIDTWILLLRGKGVFPPSNPQYFLHVFHHATTASIVWLAWRHEFNIAWMGPLTNSFVHTPMYAYYGLTEVWKGVRKYGIFITPIQIIQFIVCLSLLIPETLDREGCKATGRAIMWTWFTYVVFLSFFLKMFLDKKAARAAAKKAKKAQ